MDKLSFITLWGAYGGLLTTVQREITDLYFNKDLTVSEIAEQKGISRQAVSDCLKGCKKQLEEYEEKLHVVERLHEVSLEYSFMTTDAAAWAESFKKAHPSLSAELSALEKIIQKDYSDEVSAALSKPEMRELLYRDYTREVFGKPKTGDE